MFETIRIFIFKWKFKAYIEDISQAVIVMTDAQEIKAAQKLLDHVEEMRKVIKTNPWELNVALERARKIQYFAMHYNELISNMRHPNFALRATVRNLMDICEDLINLIEQESKSRHFV